MIAIAVSPWAGSALAGALGGYPTVFWLLVAVTVAAAGAAIGTRPALRQA